MNWRFSGHIPLLRSTSDTQRCGKDRSEVSQANGANTCLWHGIIFFFYFRVQSGAYNITRRRRGRRWNRKWGSHGTDKGSHLGFVFPSPSEGKRFNNSNCVRRFVCAAVENGPRLNSNLERLSFEQDRGNPYWMQGILFQAAAEHVCQCARLTEVFFFIPLFTSSSFPSFLPTPFQVGVSRIVQLLDGKDSRGN